MLQCRNLNVDIVDTCSGTYTWLMVIIYRDLLTIQLLLGSHDGMHVMVHVLLLQ